MPIKLLCPQCEGAKQVKVKKNWDAICIKCNDKIGAVYNYKE